MTLDADVLDLSREIIANPVHVHFLVDPFEFVLSCPQFERVVEPLVRETDSSSDVLGNSVNLESKYSVHPLRILLLSGSELELHPTRWVHE